MKKISLSIECINAAFTEYPEAEVARILRDLADRVEVFETGDGTKLYDFNGNHVGTVHEDSED